MVGPEHLPHAAATHNLPVLMARAVVDSKPFLFDSKLLTD